MKTQIHGEKIPENLLKCMDVALLTSDIQIPIHADVRLVCDRFITGTSEFQWIRKRTLLQHKSRLQILNRNIINRIGIKLLI